MPFVSREAWEAFLEERHATSDGLWLKIAKKGSGIESVTYDQAVEVALCYGWIDGQVRRLPRTKRTASRRNGTSVAKTLPTAFWHMRQWQ